MNEFNLDFFIDDLKEAFNNKTARLAFALHVVGWRNDITCLNSDDPITGEIVDGIAQNTAKRREFEREQDLMLSEDLEPIHETANKWIFLAAISWKLGLRLVACDWRDGVRLLLKSIELLDMCRGFIEHELEQHTEAEKKEQISQGGKAKAALFAPLKVEVIRLLQVQLPEGGWKSKNAAIEAIYDDMCTFIEQHGFPGSSGEQTMENDWADLFARIPRRVNDWSRDDANIKEAFDAVVKQKKKSAQKGA